MKTLKIKNSTHKILKWIQGQDALLDKDPSDIDGTIFKALVQYSNVMHYNLQALKNIVELDDDK